MEEFTAYTVERIKGKKQLVFNISCDVVFNSLRHSNMHKEVRQ